jgi:hypothetical protein
MKRSLFLRSHLPPLILFLFFILTQACKTLPPAPEDTPDEVPATEKTDTAEEPDVPAEPEIPRETPEFVIQAEEVIEPVDKNPDVSLPEAVYDLSEPEVVAALEDAAPVPSESDAPIALDEAMEKPVEETAAVEPIEPADAVEPTNVVDAVEPADTEPAETEAAVAETDETSETQADESEASPPPPPPPPLAALRPSERSSSSTPPVSQNPPEPVKAQPELPARNPPMETEKYVKSKVSRVFHVQTGKIFEVPFDNAGWIYTGEESSKSGVSYDSRRVYDDSQIFVFRAEKEGDYTLTFYKQDFLRDYVTNEYARVLVTDEAPPPEAAALSQAATLSATAALPEAASSVETAPSDSAASAETAKNEDLLQQAREAAAAQKYADAIDLLDRFRQQNPAMNDEAWWLYGQAFEAASPARDILSALDAYSCIVRDYPQSRHYTNAKNRIAFLNKFYLNIR